MENAFFTSYFIDSSSNLAWLFCTGRLLNPGMLEFWFLVKFGLKGRVLLRWGMLLLASLYFFYEIDMISNEVKCLDDLLVNRFTELEFSSMWRWPFSIFQPEPDLLTELLLPATSWLEILFCFTHLTCSTVLWVCTHPSLKFSIPVTTSAAVWAFT